MSGGTPLAFRWTGEEFIPLNRSVQKACDERFVVDQHYFLEEQAERSAKSERHYHASIREAHKNLPENLAMEYPTPNHLRKRALIQAGYFDEQIIDAGTMAAAERVARGIRSFPGEAFSLVFIRKQFVVVRRPRSQSRPAMNKEEFQKSKDDVLDIVAGMISVPVATLTKQQESA